MVCSTFGKKDPFKYKALAPTMSSSSLRGSQPAVTHTFGESKRRKVLIILLTVLHLYRSSF